MRRLAAIGAWLLAPALLVATIANAGPANLMIDFRAFYCAGTVIAQGANPYLEEPLHACEQRAGPPGPPIALLPVTLPAPLPPAALVAFVPLTRLPFPFAVAVYELFLIAAMSAAVVLYVRATGVSSVWLNLAFAAITVQTYFLGQPMPFVLLAFAGAAILLRARRSIAASACVVAAFAEPHLALPAAIGMLIVVPRARIPIVACSLAFALIGIAAVGLPTSIAYVRDVVPAHALANAYEWQFSLTSILTSLGVSAPAAIGWGTVMYVAMMVLGITVAYRIVRASGDVAAMVLLPPAFAVFGGVHVHPTQMVVAIPAILYIYSRYARVRNLAATGVTLVMIPWNEMGLIAMIGSMPLLVGTFARATMGTRRGLVMTIIGTSIAATVFGLALAGYGPGDSHFVPRPHLPTALAEESWGDFSRALLARPSVLMQVVRVPVLLGLALGLLAVSRAGFARDYPTSIP